MKNASKRFTVSALVLTLGLLFVLAVEHRSFAAKCSRTDRVSTTPAVVSEPQLIAAGDWMENDEGEQESEGYREQEGERYEGYEGPEQEGLEESDENSEGDEWEQEDDSSEPHESWQES